MVEPYYVALGAVPEEDSPPKKKKIDPKEEQEEVEEEEEAPRWKKREKRRRIRRKKREVPTPETKKDLGKKPKKIKNQKKTKKNGPFQDHPSFSKRSLSVAS